MLNILSANRLGDLVCVVAVFALELLDQRNVLLLGLLGSDALVDDLLPCVLLGLALYLPKPRSAHKIYWVFIL